MSEPKAAFDLGPPSERSAVIVRASLPAGLERLRRRSLADAAEGVPAHLTMLYPFMARSRLTDGVRRLLAGVAARHGAFDYQLRGAASWTDTIYVAVAPKKPFVALQRDLQRAFPDFPIYGRDAGFRYVPHVTIAEGDPPDRTIRADRAWRSLPRPARAAAIEVIAAGGDGRWRRVWRMPLGGTPVGGGNPATGAAADRMRR